MHAYCATRTTAFSESSIEEVETVALSEFDRIGEQVALIESFKQPLHFRKRDKPVMDGWTERWIHMAKTRLQFDFTDEALGELDDLKGATGATNRAEVIRQALRLLQWTVEQTQDQNATVLVEKNGRQREVMFPFLSPGKAVANSK
jgi:Arc/MetJ-type ribon-helix-helix transcriptional regulator